MMLATRLKAGSVRATGGHGQQRMAACRAMRATQPARASRSPAGQQRSGQAQPQQVAPAAFATSFALYLLTEAGPAMAADLAPANPFEGSTANSLYVTLALFLMSVPGIWSQIKRAPKAKVKRIVFEVPGPSVAGSMPLDERARQVFRYFKTYNYEVKGTGEVITFVGTYAAQKGQAAAVSFYTFFGMASVALVLSTLFPQGGNWWYALTLASPASYAYYMSRGTRQEEVKVKMLTADDDRTTDIIVEGDVEEIERMRKELQLFEKGKVYVKGILDGM